RRNSPEGRCLRGEVRRPLLHQGREYEAISSHSSVGDCRDTEFRGFGRSPDQRTTGGAKSGASGSGGAGCGGAASGKTSTADQVAAGVRCLESGGRNRRRGGGGEGCRRLCHQISRQRSSGVALQERDATLPERQQLREDRG